MYGVSCYKKQCLLDQLTLVVPMVKYFADGSETKSLSLSPILFIGPVGVGQVYQNVACKNRKIPGQIYSLGLALMTRYKYKLKICTC
jgi:hypothetical protein